MKPIPPGIRAAQSPGSVVECDVAVVRESGGTFSAIVLNLPGVGSCGDSEDDAIANAREAVAAAVESFHEDGVEIPWLDASGYAVPPAAILTRILVDSRP